MAGKSSKSKSGNKSDHQARQLRWTRLAFGIFAVILVLSMVLSLMATSTK